MNYIAAMVITIKSMVLNLQNQNLITPGALTKRDKRRKFLNKISQWKILIE